MAENLTINDISAIIETIFKKNQIDLRNHALSALKRRLELMIENYHLLGVDDLISRIRNSADYIELILKEISVEDTEMFREPTFWIELKNTILTELSQKNNCTIWVDSNSGEELYSLLVVLKELTLIDNIKVICTCSSSYFIEFMKLGIYEVKKMEQNAANYKRFQPLNDFKNYYNNSNNKTQMDLSLLRNTEFVKFHFTKDAFPVDINLAIIRNKMLYFNKSLQAEVIGKIHESLVLGGYLAIGVKEVIDNKQADTKYSIVNKIEKIYRKLTT